MLNELLITDRFRKISLALAAVLFFGMIFQLNVVSAKEMPSGANKKVAVAGLEASGSEKGKGAQRSCEAKEAVVKKRLENLTNQAMKMEKTFDAIALRVEDYYAKRISGGGTVVSNYESLVGSIVAKKAAVQLALDKAEADRAGFSCTTQKPKELLQKFNEDMKSVKSNLKEYRTSVRNLIVAVRSANGKEKSATASGEEASGSGKNTLKLKGNTKVKGE